MPRKRSSTRKRRIPGLEEWQLTYLLTGERPAKDTEGVNPFMELIFVHARPGDPACRHGKGLTWFEAWEQFGDDPLIQQWKLENGETFAEQKLREYQEAEC